MLARLFLLFTIGPVIELYILIKIGKVIGALPTVGILVATAFAGAWLARSQGIELLRRIQFELAQGRLPAAELLDGAMVLVGGVLLLTPGFLSDVIGLFFLIPLSRSVLKSYLGLWLQRKISAGGFVVRRF